MAMAKVLVHQLRGAWGLVSISPFCLKLDLYLRLAGIPYEVVVEGAPFKGPKRKAPWITHDGRVIGDSALIIDYLNRAFEVDLDTGLDQAQRAAARALRAMLEENLYWAVIYERWIDEKNFADFRNIVLSAVPAPVRPLVAKLARRGVRQQFNGHGMGRHSPQEIGEIAGRDITALADWLGSNEFMMGDSPSEIDAAAFGMLANIWYAPIEGALKRHVAGHENLVGYIERVQDRYYLQRGA